MGRSLYRYVIIVIEQNIFSKSLLDNHKIINQEEPILYTCTQGLETSFNNHSFTNQTQEIKRLEFEIFFQVVDFLFVALQNAGIF